MRAISVSHHLHCAWPSANHYIEAFYEQLAGDTTTRMLPLRVKLADIGLPSQMTLEREVETTLNRLPAGEVGTNGFHVEWRAAGGGPYPRFTGWLFVNQNASDSMSMLELEGTYTAPFGPLGALFDAAIGKKIAEATAHALLTDIAVAVEGACAVS